MRTSFLYSPLVLQIPQSCSFRVLAAPRYTSLHTRSWMRIKASSSLEYQDTHGMSQNELVKGGTMEVKRIALPEISNVGGVKGTLLQDERDDKIDDCLTRLSDWNYYHKFFECNYCEISGIVELDAVKKKKPSLAISFTVMLEVNIPPSVLVVMLHLMDAAKEVGQLMHLNNE